MIVENSVNISISANLGAKEDLVRLVLSSHDLGFTRVPSHQKLWNALATRLSTASFLESAWNNGDYTNGSSEAQN